MQKLYMYVWNFDKVDLVIVMSFFIYPSVSCVISELMAIVLLIILGPIYNLMYMGLQCMIWVMAQGTRGLYLVISKQLFREVCRAEMTPIRVSSPTPFKSKVCQLRSHCYNAVSQKGGTLCKKQMGTECDHLQNSETKYLNEIYKTTYQMLKQKFHCFLINYVHILNLLATFQESQW